MEILHILLIASRGGCERDCWCLCSGWKDVQHSVLVVGPPGPMSEDFENAGAKVTHLDALRVSRRERARAIANHLRGSRPQAVIVWHGMPELPIIGHALAHWQGIIYVHGGNPARKDLLQDIKYLAAERVWPSPHRPVYVCCSQYVADSFELSHYLRRFQRVVVPNGVELPPAKLVHQPRMLSASGVIVAGMMARLDVIKDQSTVIRALAMARRKGFPRLRLELLGDGPHRSHLAALAETERLNVQAGDVKFLGNRAAVYEAMAGWDMFLYGTTKAEGFGNALAEAMMLGLPSVVTDVGPMREVGGNKAAVAYVPPADPVAMADAIVRLVPDTARRVQMSRDARERAETEFCPAMFSHRYAEVLMSQSTIFHPARPAPTEC